MSIPILDTKLHIPLPRPSMVARLRLIQRLNAGLLAGHRLILISAAAGFGKTTLLSEWISHLRFPDGDASLSSPNSNFGIETQVSWLSLDAADGDPVRFFTYLAAALQTIQPGLGKPMLAALQTNQRLPIEQTLTSFLNEISALSGKYILVLDDYHLLDAPSVDAALAFLLDHIPPQLQLVIASREDPNLPLSRLRARGQLTELRAAELRFSPDESIEYLNRIMGLNLSESHITVLEARTEGWIAGLQLAALAMQREVDAPGFIQAFSGSHRYVLDYLLEEVLQRQSPGIQDFLLRTSILDRICGPLCDAVLDTPSTSNLTPANMVIETLERANLFLVPLDNERHWYRYHHLFGDLLRQRLGLSLSPQEIAQSHLRASQWLETNGDLAAAFHHAHLAGDFTRAARLAETGWKAMNDNFQNAAWLEWLKRLPEAVICAHPLLCIQAASALTDIGALAASEARLDDAERALARAPNPSLTGRITLARAYNAQVQGRIADAIHFAQLSLQLIPSSDYMQRAQAALILEFIHWNSGELEPALQAIDDWVASMKQLGNHVFVIASAFAQADLLVELGRLGDAEWTYQHALQLAARRGPQAEQITAHHHLGLSMLYRQRGQEALFTQHWRKATQRSNETTLVDWPHRWSVAQARLKEAVGELDAALSLLDEASQVYVKNPVPDLRPIAALKARIYLKQGRDDKVRDWAAKRGLALTDKASYLAEFELLTLARLEIANAQVNDLLERLLAFAQSQKRLGSMLEILLTQALAREAQGNRSLALGALERALALAEPQGYVRIFTDESETMRLLLSEFRLSIDGRSHPLQAYTDKLLAALPQPEMPNVKIENETLSPRELEILHLVAQGLSNAEISQRLYLALSTIKGHNLRIFAKLQAQNRTEAVARARALGLL